MSALTKVYEQMAVERRHVCTGCGSNSRLTHSHIIPRSQDKSLEAVMENITFHCISCHDIWEHKPTRVFLKDFQANMVYAFKTNQSFYWLRVFKMHKYWEDQINFLPASTNNAKMAPKALDVLSKLSIEIHAVHLGIPTEKIEG